jgi:hypothetical protein
MHTLADNKAVAAHRAGALTGPTLAVEILEIQGNPVYPEGLRARARTLSFDRRLARSGHPLLIGTEITVALADVLDRNVVLKEIEAEGHVGTGSEITLFEVAVGDDGDVLARGVGIL